MLNTLKRLFGFGAKQNFAALVKEGAIIVDVRSNAEFANGHIKNAVNIPVDSLSTMPIFNHYLNIDSVITNIKKY